MEERVFRNSDDSNLLTSFQQQQDYCFSLLFLESGVGSNDFPIFHFLLIFRVN